MTIHVDGFSDWAAFDVDFVERVAAERRVLISGNRDVIHVGLHSDTVFHKGTGKIEHVDVIEGRVARYERFHSENLGHIRNFPMHTAKEYVLSEKRPLCSDQIAWTKSSCCENRVQTLVDSNIRV